MGHRALIAYERPDSLYNLHYSHWGACDLRLKGTITAETPFAGETEDEDRQQTLLSLLQARTLDEVEEATIDLDGGRSQVDVESWAVQVSLDEIISE